MEWRDEALVLGVRRHGESSVIAELMTREHGRHLGMVRSGRSRAMQPVLQPGNSVDATWRARIEEHLGLYALEAMRLRTSDLMASSQALHGVGLVCALLRLLPEREPHVALYEMARLIVDRLHEAGIAPALMVRLEMAMLVELGFGLDLNECASTGAKDDLVYVSPKSGRAVSRIAGEPWRDRLLPLPDFLTADDPEAPVERDSVLAGFRLTGYFLERDLFAARGVPMPDSRAAYLACL
ncbi:MAG: repair protein RecO [Devosia sp.]|jgi:DNA repair protein RecO (recombination protein O)|uniref:DNA repair protein RecO n=1 Tax=Devosia sp. TaxID=1871048 RepID=UPI00260E04C7|nr:DNA repair protein RecO [Devosia sp.]MDB5586727.1 repair protein RecO [Devosia sp.]